MPYRLTWGPRGVYREYLDDVTILERRRSFDDICNDPRFDGLLFVITDYLAVRDYEVTPKATREIAAMHVGPLLTNPRLRIAAVAVREDVLRAIAEFKSYGIVEQPYEVFATLAQARRWAIAR